LSIDGLIHGILEFFSDPPQDTILYTKIGANLKCFNIAAPDTGVLNKGSVTYIEGATFTGCANLTQYVSGGDVPQIIRLKDVTFTAGIDTNDWDITAVSVSLAAPSVAIIGHNITLSTGSTYEYIGDFGGTLNSDGYGLVRTETLSGGAASSPPGGATTAQKFIAYSGASPIWYEKRIFAEAGDVITVSASVYLEDSFTTHEPRIEFQRAEYGDEVLFSSRVSSETLSEETPAEATSTTGSWQTILQSHTVVEAGEYRAKVSAWAEIDNGLVKAFTAGNEKIAWVIPTISRSSGGGGVVSSIVSNILE
jgi:hypothetical protein